MDDDTNDGGNRSIGCTTWAVPEGHISRASDDASESSKPEAACLLNTGDTDAQVRITAYCPDREPAGPYCVRVPPRRIVQLIFKDLREPERIPRGTDYVAVIESDVPIVVQQSRLVGRRYEVAVLSTLAYLQ